LRPTGEHFCEDPVRVLRVGYFAAKFNFNWSTLAVKYSRQLRDEFAYIEKEKIDEIFLKTAKSAIKPSQFLRFLRETDWLKFFGRLAELEEIPQNPRWHPEGNVFEHTCQVMDYYAEVFGSTPVGFYATLLHDYGKIHTTVIGKNGWIAPNHAEFSANYCSEVFDSINPLFKNKLKKEVIELCKFHMDLGDAPTAKAIRKLAFRLNDTSFLELWKLCVSDQLSRIGVNGIRPEGYEESYKNLLLWKQKFIEEMNKLPEQKIQRIVTGDTLIGYGIQPGVEMGKLLNIFQQLQIDGVLTVENSDEIVPYILKENSHE
jgi:tRNA nucleotidyltransferase (CCA-adding enzyme)